MILTMQITQTLFKEINTTGIFVLETQANLIDSVTFLRESNLRLLTFQEALSIIDKNPELKEQLKGKWFYLEGKELKEAGFYEFNETGTLTKVEGRENPERTVHAQFGIHPPYLCVRTDNGILSGWRFVIGGDVWPQDVAPVIIGIKDELKFSIPLGDTRDTLRKEEFPPPVL